MNDSLYFCVAVFQAAGFADFFANVQTLLRVLFILGFVCSYAKDSNNMISGACALLALSDIIKCAKAEEFTFNSLIFIATYAVLALLALTYGKGSIIKSNKFGKTGNNTASSSRIKTVLIAIIAIVAVIFLIALLTSIKRCDHCGKLILSDYYRIGDIIWCKECVWGK